MRVRAERRIPGHLLMHTPCVSLSAMTYGNLRSRVFRRFRSTAPRRRHILRPLPSSLGAPWTVGHSGRVADADIAKLRRRDFSRLSCFDHILPTRHLGGVHLGLSMPDICGRVVILHSRSRRHGPRPSQPNPTKVSRPPNRLPPLAHAIPHPAICSLPMEATKVSARVSCHWHRWLVGPAIEDDKPIQHERSGWAGLKMDPTSFGPFGSSVATQRSLLV
jgi:hypothetical protein